MKNVYEVLRQKELEVSKVEKEVEALRIAAPLLSDDDQADYSSTGTLGGSSTAHAPSPSDQPGRPEKATHAQ